MKFVLLLSAVTLAFPAALVSASPAAASDLITNGGFETGDFTGWTINPNPAGGYAWNVGTTNYPDGRYGAVTGCRGASCTDQGNFAQSNYLYQTVATTAGASYTLSFGYSPQGAESDLKVLFGDTVVVDLADITPTPDNSLIRYSFSNLVAAGSTMRLAFLGRQDPSYATVDSVSLVANPVTATVPEPASWAMMLGGFGAIGAALRRRKVATSFA